MSPSPLFRGALVALVSLVLASCSSETKSSSSSGGSSSGAPTAFPTQPLPDKLFSRAVSDVVVEVDYADGAEPFVGPQGKDQDDNDVIADIWGLFKANITAIFEIKNITYPSKLAQMTKIDVEAKNYSEKDILEIAKANRDTIPDDTTASYYVLFLNGNYVDADGNVDEDRLAVSVGNEGVIAMFKPAILKPAGQTIPPPAFVEQLALIHELGHAVGFVDNGVPVADSNKAHIAEGHHCTNTQCAMYGGIDTVQGAAPYAMKYVRYQTSVLIGQECLSDARIFANKLN